MGSVLNIDPRMTDDLSFQGTAAPPPVLERIAVWIELDAPYHGLKLRCWINFSRRIRRLFTAAKTEDEIEEVMKLVVLEHNGWRDADGELLPPPSDHEFWEEIPDQLMSQFLDKFREAMQELPNSRPESDES